MCFPIHNFDLLDATDGLNWHWKEENVSNGFKWNFSTPTVNFCPAPTISGSVWQGIVATKISDGKCHVTEIQLPNFNLTGQVPSTIDKLKHLATLSLPSNHLVGTLSNFVYNMTNLTKVDLSYNTIGGSIPYLISKLTRLKYFDISVNTFTGSLSTGWMHLTDLEHFFIKK